LSELILADCRQPDDQQKHNVHVLTNGNMENRNKLYKRVVLSIRLLECVNSKEEHDFLKDELKKDLYLLFPFQQLNIQGAENVR
jgi:hypothetical protein